eukprot:1145757-Pelagomonas_calceolata.AAC.19
MEKSKRFGVAIMARSGSRFAVEVGGKAVLQWSHGGAVELLQWKHGGTAMSTRSGGMEGRWSCSSGGMEGRWRCSSGGMEGHGAAVEAWRGMELR